MSKIDYKKEFKALYKPSAKAFSIVEVPAFQFLMIDGQGDPNTSVQYKEALEALFGLSYALKFALKPSGLDYTVMPLEGLWWVPDMVEFDFANKGVWYWTMMMMQPTAVDAALVETVRAEVARKKDPVALPKVRLVRYDEGLAAQILYYGPFADEGPTIEHLHAFIAEQGYERHGKHHEIYLSDPRRTAPERLKTVIRQPIQPAFV